MHVEIKTENIDCIDYDTETGNIEIQFKTNKENMNDDNKITYHTLYVPTEYCIQFGTGKAAGKIIVEL